MELGTIKICFRRTNCRRAGKTFSNRNLREKNFSSTFVLLDSLILCRRLGEEWMVDYARKIAGQDPGMDAWL